MMIDRSHVKKALSILNEEEKEEDNSDMSRHSRGISNSGSKSNVSSSFASVLSKNNIKSAK